MTEIILELVHYKIIVSRFNCYTDIFLNNFKVNPVRSKKFWKFHLYRIEQIQKILCTYKMKKVFIIAFYWKSVQKLTRQSRNHLY